MLFLGFALTVALIIGCSSGGGSQPTLPQVEKPAAKDHIGTHLWGSYQVAIDKNTSKVDITQLRGANQIINVLGFLEPPVLNNMSIDFTSLVIDSTNNLVSVNVILKHPIPDPVFMGFDVRGVVFGPDLLNADGLTPVMNPADFATEPFGYIDGLLGAPDSYAHYDGLWGFKYFCDGLGINDDVATFFSNETNLADRGVFRNGSTNTRHNDLSWVGKSAPIGFLVFNYAIYANYDWPIGEAPIDIDNFSITANCSEAFCFKATEIANSLYFVDDTQKGGTLSLDVEVWDWQAIDSAGVDLEGIAPTNTDPGTTSKSKIFHFVDYDPGADLTTNAGLVLTIKATDPTTFGGAWFMGLLSTDNPLYGTPLYVCFKYTAAVSPEAPPAGLTIKASGDLPANLPTSDQKNFCVVGDDGFGRAGVYYHYSTDGGENRAIYEYPLDYSSAGTAYIASLTGDPWMGNPNSQWWGPASAMGPIEVTIAGAWALTSTDPGFSGWSYYDGYQWWDMSRNGIMVWGSPGSGTPNQGDGWGNMRIPDIDESWEIFGTIWAFFSSVGVGQIVPTSIQVSSPYGGWDFLELGVWGAPYFPEGPGDCNVSTDVIAWANDYDPQDVGAFTIVNYFLEGPPDSPAVEVIYNMTNICAPSCKYTLNGANGLVGTGRDLSVLNVFGKPGYETFISNWLCILEENGDGTWQVSAWQWNGATSQLELVERYEPAIAGKPLRLDCDTTNQLIHVWCDEGGTLKYYIFGYGD